MNQPRVTYFLDSSAAAKRYAREVGTAWVEALCVPAAGSFIALAQIGLVEVAAVLAAKRRGNIISPEEYEKAVEDLITDSHEEYALVDIDQATIDRAIQLTRRQKLRGCDAVQLAAALSLNKSLLENKLPGLTFVTADNDLLIAAANEGLATENPNVHASSDQGVANG